jgi:hypothetical protein
MNPMDELQALNLPMDVDVNCTAGAGVNSVQGTHAKDVPDPANRTSPTTSG